MIKEILQFLFFFGAIIFASSLKAYETQPDWGVDWTTAVELNNTDEWIEVGVIKGDLACLALFRKPETFANPWEDYGVLESLTRCQEFSRLLYHFLEQDGRSARQYYLRLFGG